MINNISKYAPYFSFIVIIHCGLMVLCTTDINNHSQSAGIILTFDDHFIENWSEAVELLTSKYEFKAVFYVDHFDQLTSKEFVFLKEMESSGSEIGCHGLRHLNAQDYCQQHSVQSYVDSEIVPAIQLMDAQGFTVTSFAYPFGKRSAVIDESLVKYFRFIRGTIWTQITDIPESYYLQFGDERCVVNGVNIDDNSINTIEDIKRGILYAKQNHCMIILYGHNITKTSDKGAVSFNRLTEICEFTKQQNMHFYTFKDLIEIQ